MNGQADDADDADVFELGSANGRSTWAFVAIDATSDNTPAQVVDRTWRALEHTAQRVASHGGRVGPLIGIPLVGTGHGGLETRRAEVIDMLLDRSRATALRSTSR